MFSVIFSLALALPTFLSVTAQPGVNYVPPGATVTLGPFATDECLSADENAENALVEVLACSLSSPNANQIWNVTAGSGPEGILTTFDGTKCLAVPDNIPVAKNGSPVRIETCTGDESQLFSLMPDASLVWIPQNKCLQFASFDFGPSDPVTINDCGELDTQQFFPLIVSKASNAV